MPRRYPRGDGPAAETIALGPRPAPLLPAPPVVPPGVPAAERLVLGMMAETNGGSALEPVAGFDAYRARNRGLLPAPVERRPQRERPSVTIESVIGADDRVPVPDTTALPWRAIALLSITYANGRTAQGTAWFLGPDALGTAGHNVRHPDHGTATEIVVSPAFDGSLAPFGSALAVAAHAPPGWVADAADPALDYAVLRLADAAMGTRLGWFGYAAYADAQLVPLLVNVSGYPVDRAPRTQYFNGGRIEDAQPRFLLYAFDTEGGMSGAPIFALFGSQRVAVGIHTHGTTQGNRARRIDAEVFDFLRRWSA